MTKVQYTDNYRISPEPGMFAQLRKKCKGKEKEIAITLLALGALALTAALSMGTGSTPPLPPQQPPTPPNPPTVRSVTITLTGRLKGNTTVNRTITETVQMVNI